jgi:molybdopterin-synthase adenylyltransferase
LSGWDDAAQQSLGGASSIVVGAGGLGAPACAYLAVAGVGRIGIVDGATVEPSSLHRQALHFAAEIGANKAESAALKIGALNPEVRAEPYPVRLEQANAAAILAGADVALDCSGSSDTRRLVNEACCAERLPLVTADVRGLSGFLMSMRPGESACHACVFSESAGQDESGDEPGAGSPGAIAGTLGALQALEALKLLTGVGRPLLDRVLRLDGGDMVATVESVERREGCPACAGEPAARQSR